MKANYQTLYEDQIIGSLNEQFKFPNPMQVPKLEKIVLNIGLKESDNKAVEAAVSDMTLITGQKPVITKAKKSIAGFKLREHTAIGCKVTLRGKHMYEFLERLVTIALPRVRDFRGLSPKSFDGNGNYAFGLKEQIVFPEIDYDKIDKIRGMDVIIVTSANNDNHARELLRGFNMPFTGQQQKQQD